MDKVLNLAANWTEKNKPVGSEMIIKKSPERTPLLLLDIPGTKEGNILMYGHLDKQPEMEGWNDDLGPWKPVIKDEKLYGRGGADDGYALFASIASINALKEQKIDHPRILVLIEFSEESGSPDLPHYMDLCSDIIGSPDLVICLDWFVYITHNHFEFQKDYVKKIGEECVKYDILFLFELLVYPFMNEKNYTDEYLEMKNKKTDHVLQSIEEFSKKKLLRNFKALREGEVIRNCSEYNLAKEFLDFEPTKKFKEEIPILYKWIKENEFNI